MMTSVVMMYDCLIPMAGPYPRYHKYAKKCGPCICRHLSNLKHQPIGLKHQQHSSKIHPVVTPRLSIHQTKLEQS